MNKSGLGKSLTGAGTAVRKTGALAGSPITAASKAAAQRSANKKALNYGSYIIKVLKEYNKKATIGKRALAIMNSFVIDILDRIAAEATKLCQYARRETMTHQDIVTATMLVVKGDLAKHAVDQGKRAIKTLDMNSPKRGLSS